LPDGCRLVCSRQFRWQRAAVRRVCEHWLQETRVISARRWSARSANTAQEVVGLDIREGRFTTRGGSITDCLHQSLDARCTSGLPRRNLAPAARRYSQPTCFRRHLHRRRALCWLRCGSRCRVICLHELDEYLPAMHSSRRRSGPCTSEEIKPIPNTSMASRRPERSLPVVR